MEKPVDSDHRHGRIRASSGEACSNRDKLAQFDFLRRIGTVPLLLLDDIFDKLDAHRVEQIIKLVGSDRFGQIFITDTNRENLDRILEKVQVDYSLFSVSDGVVIPIN